MKATKFVEKLRSLKFENTFNPYSNACSVHDLADAPSRRSKTLVALINAAMQVEVDAIWVGRDLGYRGGRRTGLALTDDVHIDAHLARWELHVERPTKGEAVAERTAAVVWDVLSLVKAPVFLWNVFPLHPYEEGDPFSNRTHNSRERAAGEAILEQLVRLVQPRRIVAIGNDAARAVTNLHLSIESCHVRHPSYGGQTEFRQQIRELYRRPFR